VRRSVARWVAGRAAILAVGVAEFALQTHIHDLALAIVVFVVGVAAILGIAARTGIV
jgi:hypothetical protein